MITTIEKKVEHACTALISNVTYKMTDFWFGCSERPLTLSLLLPKEHQKVKPQPLLVFICGGNFRVVDADVWIPELIYFAENGFTVASITYRTVNEAPWPAPLEDICAAIRYLCDNAGRYAIDPNHIITMGESAGGVLAVHAGILLRNKQEGTLQQTGAGISGHIDGIVDLYGPVDFRMDYEDTQQIASRTGAFLLRIDDFPEKISEKWAEYDILQHINASTPPVMILHGTKDSKVSIRHSEELYDKLQQNHVPAELIRIEGAEHGDDCFYQTEIQETILQFMRRCMNHA